MGLKGQLPGGWGCCCRVRALSEAALQHVGAVRAAEHYIRAMRGGILDEIAAGGIRGSAALKHELAEVAALTKAGRNIFDPDAIAAIRADFAAALKHDDPARYIPWHLQALREELEYAERALRRHGVSASDLREVARALYGELEDLADEKMLSELLELGIAWPRANNQELIDALSLSPNLE